MDKNTTYQTGNTAATKFESLVNRLYVSLCFAANRFLGDKTAAQDIVQEAFARLWELQGKNKNIENIDNYMYMLVHNLSLEWLRTRKLQAKYLNNHPLKEVNIFNVIVEADVAMQILAEIEKLPPRSKQVMQLAFQGLDNQQIAQEINGCAEYFKEVTGQDMPPFFRPPEGVYSIRTLEKTQELGYKTIFWSFAYRDWVTDDQPGKEAAFNNIINYSHNGCIMLLHAVSESNTQALDSAIKELKAQGYTFESLYRLP